MSDLSRFSRGRFLKAGDVPSGTVVEMRGGRSEEFEDGAKAVLETDIGDIVLNKTNLRAVEEITGQLTDSDRWYGFQCVIKVERVAFSGRMVASIRIYPVESNQAASRPQTRPAPAERDAPEHRPAGASRAPNAPRGGPLKPARDDPRPQRTRPLPMNEPPTGDDIPF